MLTVCYGSAGKATQTEARDFWAQASVFPGRLEPQVMRLPPPTSGRVRGQTWRSIMEQAHVSLREMGVSSGGKEPLWPLALLTLSGMFVLNSFLQVLRHSVQFSYLVISDSLHVLEARKTGSFYSTAGVLNIFHIHFYSKDSGSKEHLNQFNGAIFFVPQFCKFIRAGFFPVLRPSWTCKCSEMEVVLVQNKEGWGRGYKTFLLSRVLFNARSSSPFEQSSIPRKDQASLLNLDTWRQGKVSYHTLHTCGGQGFMHVGVQGLTPGTLDFILKLRCPSLPQFS